MSVRHAPYVAAVALSLVGMAGMYGRTTEPPPVESHRPLVMSSSVESLTVSGEWSEPVVAYYSDGTRLPVPFPRVLTLAEARERAFAEAVADSPWARTPGVARVARCESRFESDAVSPDGQDRGLMQVRASAHPDLAARYDLLDPRQNLEAAWIVFTERGGWAAWSCAR